MKYVYVVLNHKNILLKVFSTEEKAEEFCKTYNDKWMFHSISEMRSVASVKKEKVY